MLTPDYLAAVGDAAVALYDAYQTALLEDIARRLTKLGITDVSVWQMQMYQEAGGVFDDAMKRIAEMTSTNQRAIQELFEEAGAKSIAFDAGIYKAAGLTPLPLSMSPRMLQVLMAGLQKTQGQLHNLTLTTANTAYTAYINAANNAYLLVAGGGMSYQQAIAKAVRDAAHQGLTVMYPTEHVDKLDVAVRRAVVTGVNQTAAQMQLVLAEEMGSDLVEVTAHMGARPSHAVWQGGIYSISGRHPNYADFRKTTQYGSGDGLAGWNCRHNFYPFIEGVSTPNYTCGDLDALSDKTVTVDGEEMSYYDATQRQRYLEREIRKTKRELLSARAAAEDEDENLRVELEAQYKRAAKHLSGLRSDLKLFEAETELPSQKDRTQVLGFDQSAAQKARWAARIADDLSFEVAGWHFGKFYKH